ncbi:MAG: PIN domain nuclease [Planctomycetes bacterium]|nr:PIN domain nuclease [Planctomycetota bacterium]
MILVDTSVFIDFFNAKKNQQVKLLIELLENSVPIAINGLIYQEVLQGIRIEKSYKEIKGILDDFYYINTPESIYLDSANMFRKLQAKGITIRKSVDIIIAQTAINSNIPLLQHDRDFTNISLHTKLNLYTGL